MKRKTTISGFTQWKWYILLITMSIGYSVNAQSSDLHYLPPLKQQLLNQAIQQQAIYLSTPVTSPFTVNIYRGTNTTPIASVSLSKAAPVTYNLPDGDNNITLVTDNNTGIVLGNSGLRLEAPTREKFYVNYRGRSRAQATSLTSKGRSAMGTDFRWGGPPIKAVHATMSASLGIMATEDNTTIDIFGYDPNCKFRLKNNPKGITANSLQIILNAGESYVLEALKSESTANVDGWIGTTISSDKNIVISNGGLNFGVNSSSLSRDAGIDQPVPVTKIGKEYIFIRGNGNNISEFPIIIGTQNNTAIFVNGSATPIATINNGDYFEVPGNLYSGGSAGDNMLVTTSKNVYAYQVVSGSIKESTVGLNFVAPVSCLLPSTMDYITSIKDIAGLQVNVGLTIVASVSTPDANITVTDGSGTVSLPASKPVAGSTKWKTFYVNGINGDVSVQSTGPIAVGYLGYNNARGVAGYFSGFDTAPVVNLQLSGGGCIPGASIEVIGANYDAYQWFENGTLVSGATASSYTPTRAGDYFVRVTKGACTYDSQTLASYYCDPDLVVKKKADTNNALEGDTVTYTITVESLGVDPVTNFILKDMIPTGLTLTNANSDTGTWTDPDWNIGTLNSGNLFTLVLETTVDDLPFNSATSSYTNTVSHTQDQTDGNETPDDLSETINVENNEITATKEEVAAPDGAYDTLGEVITYKITVTNAGVSTLSNISITDPNADPGSISPVNVASLAPAASANFTAKHTVNATDFSAYQVMNTATAQAELPNGHIIYDTSDDPNDPTNGDNNRDGEPDDVTVTKLHNPRTVITNRRITIRVKNN